MLTGNESRTGQAGDIACVTSGLAKTPGDRTRLNRLRPDQEGQDSGDNGGRLEEVVVDDCSGMGMGMKVSMAVDI